MEAQESLLENPCFTEPRSFSKFRKITPSKNMEKPLYFFNQEKTPVSKKSGLNLLEESVSSGNLKPTSFDYSVFNQKKYKIFYNLPETKDEILRIDLDFPNEATVEDALPDILLKFNEKFKDEQINFSFDPSRISAFELLLASKSGKAKTLMPSIERNQTLSMTGLSNFALIDKEEGKRNVKRTKDLFSLESKETYWPNESVENDMYFKDNQIRSESFLNAKRTYTNNSLINMRTDRNGEGEKNGTCLNYCKFSFCK